MELARGVVIAGKYRIERPLATGGMGSVWVARHTQLETEVAIKFMDPQSASSSVARARFEREAKASATLRNRHVVHVLDYGLESDLPYIVMELLRGEDLSKRLHRERRLSLEAASRILSQVAKGLRTAHEAHVIHRDLKPANIFLAREEGEDEVVKVLDFGIAKDVSGGLIGEGTKTGELMGSPHYMSPEQVRASKDIDHRSDLWSLSVIMFRALTGRMPFNGDNVGAVIAQILADPIPVASEVAPDLPPAVDAFLARGFARNRELRFQSVREMADAFAAIAAAPASAGHPEEPPTRPRMPSNYSLAADTPLPTRADLASIPTGSMPLPGDGPTPAGASPTSVGTGGPVIHTAPPPPPARPSPLRWLPLAGAVLGVLIGVVAFLAVQPTKGVAAGAGEGLTPSAAPVASGSAAAPPPEPAVTAEPTATASAAPTVKATSSAAPASKPATKAKDPGGRPPPPPPAKKPNWGF
jgi:serine/threonine-protein kinase